MTASRRNSEQQPKEIAASKYFMEYQLEWLRDKSKYKIWEKSRRIGATYVQSFEDVYDILTDKTIPSVWFSSADESAAKEYIIYCAQWAKIFKAVADDLGEIVLDDEKGIKAFCIQFSNGKRINALSSNPKAFRSKGGKVVLDEFAHHKDAKELWKAAKPAVTWGYPIRILSTHNSKMSLFYKFIESIKKGKLKWSLQTTTIFDAVADGIVAKILGHETTPQEEKDWLDELRESCGDTATWEEEFCCVPVDEKSAFLPYDEIQTVESDEAFELSLPVIEAKNPKSNFYLGIDIARKHDLTVLWLMREDGDILKTAKVETLKNVKFSMQKDIIKNYLQTLHVSRCCIDSTGIGMQLAEELVSEFGSRVEAVTFTSTVKEELAFGIKSRVDDKRINVPADQVIREDLHSVKKLVTTSGNIRFDVDRSETDGHADRFWALALAVHACSKTLLVLPEISTRKNPVVKNRLFREFV